MFSLYTDVTLDEAPALSRVTSVNRLGWFLEDFSHGSKWI
jgi:hypothetical protein